MMRRVQKSFQNFTTLPTSRLRLLLLNLNHWTEKYYKVVCPHLHECSEFSTAFTGFIREYNIQLIQISSKLLISCNAGALDTRTMTVGPSVTIVEPRRNIITRFSSLLQQSTVQAYLDVPCHRRIEKSPSNKVSVLIWNLAHENGPFCFHVDSMHLPSCINQQILARITGNFAKSSLATSIWNQSFHRRG